MNHKRKGPKSTRAGCLLCKPHKHQGNRHTRRGGKGGGDMKRSDMRWQLAAQDMRD